MEDVRDRKSTIFLNIIMDLEKIRDHHLTRTVISSVFNDI